MKKSRLGIYRIAAVTQPDWPAGPGILGQFPPPSSGGGQFGVVSWTASQTYTKAIAKTSFAGSNATPEVIQLFSGLTLGPGTYYLTLAGLDPAPIFGGSVGYSWISANPSDASFHLVRAPGVTIGHQMLTTTNLSSGC